MIFGLARSVETDVLHFANRGASALGQTSSSGLLTKVPRLSGIKSINQAITGQQRTTCDASYNATISLSLLSIPGTDILAMPPHRNMRPAREGEIPDQFIVNWRKMDPRNGPKPTPLVRRAITACENCRAAKVRCNGHQDCERCIARHLMCTYHQTASPALDTRSSHESEKDMSASPPASTHETGQVHTQYMPSLVDMSHNAVLSAAPNYMEGVSTAFGSGTNIESVMPLDWSGDLPPNVSPLLSSLAPLCPEIL